MIRKVILKVQSNITIYKQDVKLKGLYWSIVHRLYKIPHIKKILRPVIIGLKPQQVLVGNHVIYIDKYDAVLSQELLQSHTWEKYQSKLFLKYIKKGDIVVDIGAHIGYYTLLAAKKVGKRGHVYAFEPDSKNYSLLTKNLRENGYENVTLVHAAVSDKVGSVNLYVHETNTGDHSIVRGMRNTKKVRVKTMSLDTYFKTKPFINVMKIDIQGAEDAAIRGGRLTLKNNNVLFTEFYPSALVEGGCNPIFFLNNLRKFGYEIYDVNETNKTVQKITQFKRFVESFDIPDPSGTSFTNLLCKKKANISSFCR